MSRIKGRIKKLENFIRPDVPAVVRLGHDLYIDIVTYEERQADTRPDNVGIIGWLADREAWERL